MERNGRIAYETIQAAGAEWLEKMNDAEESALRTAKEALEASASHLMVLYSQQNAGYPVAVIQRHIAAPHQINSQSCHHYDRSRS